MNLSKNIRKIHIAILWQHLDNLRKKQYLALLILMGLSSILEMVGIGAMLPFLAVLSEPERVFLHEYSRPLITTLGLNSPRELIYPISAAFIVLSLTALALKWITNWLNIKIGYLTGGDLSYKIYKIIINQPYSMHVRNNSGVTISLLTQKADILAAHLITVASLISGILSLLAIVLALLFIDPSICVTLAVIYTSIYLITTRLTQKRLQLNGEIVARESPNIIRCIQESLGGIRDIIIDSKQEFYCNIFKRADTPVRNAQGSSSFLITCPKYVVDGVTIVMVTTLSLYLSTRTGGLADAVPILGAFALGAQRLIPQIHGVYASLSSIKGSHASREEALNIFIKNNQTSLAKNTQQNLTIAKPWRSWKLLTLNNIWFKFDNNRGWILKDITLTVKSGSCIGIVGASGQGKSTLIDVIIGLLDPNSGTVSVDEIPLNAENIARWQKGIAHIPQFIYLSDSTIAENIAFGVPKGQINMDRLRSAVTSSQLDETILNLPDKLNTRIGERGVQLSGGQRQRIGIARALYKESNILIFDEATNSLDMKTEEAIMETIHKLTSMYTIIIISHRLSTLKNCTAVFEVANGKIFNRGKLGECLQGN